MTWYDREWRPWPLDDVTAPLTWRKPRRMRVQLFDADTETPAFWDRMFAVFALTPHLTWLVVTDRPERMREYLIAEDRLTKWCDAGAKIKAPRSVFKRIAGMLEQDFDKFEVAEDGDNILWNEIDSVTDSGTRPLPNVHLGVRASCQTELDARVPELLACPAASRFLLLDPMRVPRCHDARSLGHTRRAGRHGRHDA